jgi:acetyl esterase/lipase
MQTLTYVKRASSPLLLDLYTPIGQGPFPLLVLIHGGGWVSGNRQQLAAHATNLLGCGLAVASIDYRLAPENRWPAQRDDVEAAVSYLRAHAKELNLKADRVAAAGESAGAHLSLWLAVHGSEKSRVQAVGLISPLVDLSIPMTPTGESYQIVQKTLGPNYPRGIKDFSPINFVSATTPPVFFLHGEKDPWVPKPHVEGPAARLRALGVPVEVVYVPSMGHGLDFTHKEASAEQAVALRKLGDWAKGVLAK